MICLRYFPQHSTILPTITDLSIHRGRGFKSREPAIFHTLQRNGRRPRLSDVSPSTLQIRSVWRPRPFPQSRLTDPVSARLRGPRREVRSCAGNRPREDRPSGGACLAVEERARRWPEDLHRPPRFPDPAPHHVAHALRRRSLEVRSGLLLGCPSGVGAVDLKYIPRLRCTRPAPLTYAVRTLQPMAISPSESGGDHCHLAPAVSYPAQNSRRLPPGR